MRLFARWLALPAGLDGSPLARQVPPWGSSVTPGTGLVLLATMGML